MMLAHDHSIETLVDLIRADLASVQTEHRGRGTPIEVARVKINAKGRLALQMPRAKKVSHEAAVKTTLRIYLLLTREEAEQITLGIRFPSPRAAWLAQKPDGIAGWPIGFGKASGGRARSRGLNLDQSTLD
jgi:hypothetical protein